MELDDPTADVGLAQVRVPHERWWTTSIVIQPTIPGGKFKLVFGNLGCVIPLAYGAEEISPSSAKIAAQSSLTLTTCSSGGGGECLIWLRAGAARLTVSRFRGYRIVPAE